MRDLILTKWYEASLQLSEKLNATASVDEETQDGKRNYLCKIGDREFLRLEERQTGFRVFYEYWVESVVAAAENSLTITQHPDRDIEYITQHVANNWLGHFDTAKFLRVI